MGGKQSKLKSEVERLKTEAAQSTAKLQKEVDTLQNEKRALEFKLGVLEEMAAHAQLEAEKMTQKAADCEERAEALKWELVRHLSVPVKPAGAITPSVSSLSPSATLSPQISMRWKLKDDVKLRRSTKDVLSKSFRTSEAKISNQDAMTKAINDLPAKTSTNQTKQVPEENKTFTESKSTSSMNKIDTFVSVSSSNSSSSDESEARNRTRANRAKR